MSKGRLPRSHLPGIFRSRAAPGSRSHALRTVGAAASREHHQADEREGTRRIRGGLGGDRRLRRRLVDGHVVVQVERCSQCRFPGHGDDARTLVGARDRRSRPSQENRPPAPADRSGVPRLHLAFMAALVALLGRTPLDDRGALETGRDESTLSGVSQIARAYAMPAFAIDRHTNRGHNCLDTAARLKGYCDTLQLPLPCDAWKSHGPSPHAPRRMGFEEFVEHVQRCERENGGGRAPLFAEEALAL